MTLRAIIPTDLPAELGATPGRVCGACSECCEALGVDVLAKPAWRPCYHQEEGGGCRIHGRGMPVGCEGFECLWRVGGLTEEERPDRTGLVVIARRQVQSGLRRFVVHAREESQAALDLVARLAAFGPSRIDTPDRKRRLRAARARGRSPWGALRTIEEDEANPR